jgi:hypothetical protein
MPLVVLWLALQSSACPGKDGVRLWDKAECDEMITGRGFTSKFAQCCWVVMHMYGKQKPVINLAMTEHILDFPYILVVGVA